MFKKFCRSIAIIVLVVAGVAHAASDEFFSGKVIRIIVGSSAGGGFDVYARTIARYMGKHIPGNPTFIVENMPGAGHRIAANYVYRIAKPDGLTIGHFFGGLLCAHQGKWHHKYRKMDGL
jgi:tripartite-type tricarboxylate transporter receptor subunit TctC